MTKLKLVKTNEKIAEGVIGGYKKIENGVVGGYQKIKDSVVGGVTKMTDKFVNSFLSKEGESIENAKKRVEEEQAGRKKTGGFAMKKRAGEQGKRINNGIEACKHVKNIGNSL